MASPSQIRIDAAAKQLDWPDDIKLLMVCGYIAKTHPELDVEKFTTATANYQTESGIAAPLLTKLFCTLIDEDEKVSNPDKLQISGFTTYLAGLVESARKKQPAEEPAAKKFELSVSIPADVTDEVAAALKNAGPVASYELNDAIVRCHMPVADGYGVYLDVVNAEPTPALSLTLVRNSKTVTRHRPVRLKQWQELRKGEKCLEMDVGWPDGNLVVRFQQ